MRVEQLGGQVRARRVSRPTKHRIRTITTYCDGGTRTTFTIKRSDDDQAVVPGSDAPRSRRLVPRPAKPFRLTLLHNNDGESKYVVGDSIANYGGITRFKTVLERAPRRGQRTDVVPGGRGEGHGHDQLRRQLPRRPEPPRLLPALRRRSRPVL